MWHSPLLSLLLCTLLVLGQNLSDCTAFSSNGLAASQYQYYRFYDFRRMRSASPSNTSIQGTRAKTISDSAWKDDWYIRDYPRKSPGGYSIPVNYIPERVYITNETDSSVNATSFLSLNTERLDAETQDGGEILFTEFNISHASLRVLTRVHGAPGGVAGIFTYLNDTQESDIEIFTRTPSQYVQYSNQPASTGEPDWTPIPGATVNLTMPSGKVRTDWHVHRLDWTPGLSVFFLDDQQMNSTSLHVPVVSPPSGFYIDMWSANSSWSGSMEVGTNATMDILWIEMLFNTTEQDQVTGAKKICEVNAGVVAQMRASMGISVRSSPWLILVLAAVVSSVLT